MKLHRYWITFEGVSFTTYRQLLMGCGVTALTPEDALFIIQKKMLENEEPPPVKEMIVDVDVSTLDSNHILPNIRGNVTARGIWFPGGFQ